MAYLAPVPKGRSEKKFDTYDLGCFWMVRLQGPGSHGVVTSRASSEPRMYSQVSSRGARPKTRFWPTANTCS